MDRNVGDRDGLPFDAARLAKILDYQGIVNGFEIHAGRYVSGVADRFQTLGMWFLSSKLQWIEGCL